MTLKFLEEVKLKNRYCGAVFDSSKGKLFIAARLRSDIQRHGHKSLTAASDASDTSWSLDSVLLTKLRLGGVVLLGFYLWDDETLYLTSMTNFMTLGSVNYMSRRGARSLRYGKNFPMHFRVLAKCPAPEKLKRPRPRKIKKPK